MPASKRARSPTSSLPGLAQTGSPSKRAKREVPACSSSSASASTHPPGPGLSPRTNPPPLPSSLLPDAPLHSYKHNIGPNFNLEPDPPARLRTKIPMPELLTHPRDYPTQTPTLLGALHRETWPLPKSIVGPCPWRETLSFPTPPVRDPEPWRKWKFKLPKSLSSPPPPKLPPITISLEQLARLGPANTKGLLDKAVGFSTRFERLLMEALAEVDEDRTGMGTDTQGVGRRGEGSL